MASEVVFRWRSDSSQLRADIEATIAGFQKLEQRLRQLGSNAGVEFAAFGKKQVEQAQKLNSELEKIERVQGRLRSLQSELPKNLRVPISQVSERLGKEATEEVRQFAPDGLLTEQRITEALLALDQRRAALNDQITQKRLQSEALYLQAVKQRAQAEREFLATVEGQNRVFQQRRTDRALTGGDIRDTRASREQDIDSKINALNRQIVEIREKAFAAIPGRLTDEAERYIDRQRDREAQQTQRINKLLQEQAAIRERIAAGVNTPQDFKDELRVARELKEAQRERLKAQVKAEGPEAQLNAIERYSGALEKIAEKEAQLLRLQQERERIQRDGLIPPDDAKKLDRINRALLGNVRAQERFKDDQNQLNQLRRVELQLLEQRNAILRRSGVSPEIIGGADFRNQLGRLTSTLVSAFDDIGRRFVTTLQFAISGALIFGVQQALREFIQSAFQVERTFADLGTALEFDIDAERGTAEFSRVVNDVRMETLELSKEFNILPQDVNKAAFVMISRFKDTENALKALRSQLLATKVSTIDQAEVLRALTAITEAYTNQIFVNSEGLELQEKFLLRETIAADLYAKTLDNAVVIQQKFGIEVEDTLEGTARAAEVFGQLGFSLEQTQSIVSAVAFQLGQTGTVASEKLVRSIGQINSDKIRNDLLKVAEASDALFLTETDFVTGERAFNALATQFERLSRVDPKAAQEVLQIVGQRREVEAVAAAFGSLSVQTEALASIGSAATGAADRRFDVLAQTADEIVKSIGAGVDELAQNLAELEVITPLKALLASFDSLIGFINNGLEGLAEFKQRLNELIPGLDKLGDTIFRIFTFAAAIGTTALFAKAGFQAAQILGAKGTSFLARQGGIEKFFLALTALQVKVAAAGGGFTGLRVALAQSIAAIRAEAAQRNVFSRGALAEKFPVTSEFFSRAGGRLSGLASKSVFGVTLGTIAKFSLAIGGLAAVFNSVINVSKNLEQREKDLAAARRDAAIQAEREIRSRDIDPGSDEANVLRREAGLEAARTQRTVVYEDPEKFLDRAMRRILRALFDNYTEEADQLLGEPKRLADQTVVDAWKELLLALLRQLKEEGSRAGFGSQQDAIEFGIQTQGFASDIDSATTEEELAAVEAAINLAILNVGEEAAEALREIELTADRVKRRFTEVANQIEFGEISVRNAIPQLDTELAELVTKLQNPNLSEEDRSEYEELYYDKRRERFQILEDGLREEIAAIETGTDALSVAEDKVGVLLRLLEAAEQEYGRLSPRYNALLREVQTAQREARDIFIQRGIDDAQQQVSLATNTEGEIAATRALIDALRAAQQAVANSNTTDFDAWRQFQQQIQQANLRLAQLFEDQAVRLAAAKVRLSGPILSPILQAQADVAKIKEQLRRATEGTTEYIELQVDLAEAIANLAQAQFDQVSAFAIASAGVRDQIGLLEVQYALAVKELELIGRLFGETSARFAEGELAIAQAEAQLIDAQLSLEDVNRRLSSDLSNSFEQAQLDIVEIARKLQVPNLGKLEEAQLQLELAEAELAAVAAFFDDQIFNLQFDLEFGNITESQYVSALKGLLEQVDLSTTQGKEIWRQINGLIEGMTEDVSELAFNIPDAIRLPTLFEVRRAVQAEQLGVNYQDNREQEISFYVSNEVDLDAAVQTVLNAIGGDVTVSAQRLAPGGSRLTVGGIV